MLDENYNNWFACSSCWETTNSEGYCSTCHIIHSDTWSIIPKVSSSEDYGDVLDASNECARIIDSGQERSSNVLWQMEYIISGRNIFVDVQLLDIEYKGKTKRIFLQIKGAKYRFDLNQNWVSNCCEWKGTKKSQFTKKYWKKTMFSPTLLNFIREKFT